MFSCREINKKNVESHQFIYGRVCITTLSLRYDINCLCLVPLSFHMLKLLINSETFYSKYIFITSYVVYASNFTIRFIVWKFHVFQWKGESEMEILFTKFGIIGGCIPFNDLFVDSLEYCNIV